MTKIFYDLEFNETVEPMDLISIGMVSETGEKLYCINSDLDVIRRAARHPWIANNVLNHLPVQLRVPGGWEWDFNHPDMDKVFPTSTIAEKVKQFVLSPTNPELWAYYGAYDHVIMCKRLFGVMIDLPYGFPKFTNDIMTIQKDYDGPLPEQAHFEHNALADAEFNFYKAKVLGIV